MANDADMNAHESTYGGVIGLLKWGALACILLAFFVVWLIA